LDDGGMIKGRPETYENEEDEDWGEDEECKGIRD